MPQLHPPARSTGCRPIFAAATPAAHRCRAWAHAPKTAVLRVLLHPAQTRSCAEMTAISRQAGGRTDRFVAQLVHRRAISPRRLSPAVRQATGGTERSSAADWVSVHTYWVYYGVGQRRPLWVVNAGVLTAFATLRTSVCPRCVPGRDWPSAYSQYPEYSQRVRTTAGASSPHELRCGCCLCLLAHSHSFCRALVAGAFFVVGDPNLGSVSGVCVSLSLSVCLCAHM
jgi:hypothetical protein